MRRALSSIACCVVLLCTASALAASTTVVISQFRTRGPLGGNDEFIELFNLGDDEIDVSGWKIDGSNSSGGTSTRVTLAAGVRMAPKSFLLLTNATASGGYSGTVVGDATYTTGVADNGGLALRNAAGMSVDQVGMAAGSAYKEGTTLVPMTTADLNKAFLRGTTLCGPDKDTDDNFSDFALGTPDPRNRYSCRPACASGDACILATRCTDSNTTSTSYDGTATCPDGTGPCAYTPTVTPCPVGCDPATGLCLVDLCEGVTCNTPPDTCHGAEGTCSAGTCSYPVLVGQECDDLDACTLDDACQAGGACSGSAVFCPPTPGPICADASTLRIYSNARCDAGNCIEDHTDIHCAFGCDGILGQCRTDPCLGIVCITPPNLQCFLGLGVCLDGACEYPQVEVGTGCNDGSLCTTEDACDLLGECAGQATVCTPPPPGCVGGNRVTYSDGQCDAATGGCLFTETIENCAYGCNPVGAVCNPDPCTGVVCDQPPNLACYQSLGVCSLGTCTYTPLAVDSVCSDGNACTESDACNSQHECSGIPVVCDPVAPVCADADTSRSFAAGTCQPDGLCTYATTDTPCEFGCAEATGLCSGDPCTGVVCATPPSDCHLGTGSCQDGVCSYGFKPAASPCEDGAPCTEGDQCDGAGHCAGSSLVCNTPPNDRCYEPTGACHAGECEYPQKAVSALCNDGNPCTVDETCDAAAQCVGIPKDCVPPATTCVAGNSRSYSGGVCRIDNGECEFATSDTPCPYGCDSATGLCKNNPCLGVTCTTPPNSQCYETNGTCTDGTCGYPTRNPGTGCDDGDPCTTGDICGATQECSGVPISCTTPPNTQCWAATGTCAGGECTYVARDTGTSCDDGNACTDADACTEDHACSGTSRVCNTPPNAQCYEASGTCSVGECTYIPKSVSTVCDDGNACTENDVCSATQACAGTGKVCTPPAPTCEDGVSRVPANGTCDPADGSCTFDVTLVTCAAGCGTNGLCRQSVLIAEFRTRGPLGGNDEYVELYNAGDGEADLSGWMLDGSNASGTKSTRLTIAAGVRMPPQSFLLLTNLQVTNGYSGQVPGDATYTSGVTDDGGLALKDAAGATVDQVGMSAGSAFKEGTPLAKMVAGDAAKAYQRRTSVCGPDQDTGDNSLDFVLVSPADPRNSRSCRPACAADRCPAHTACSDANTSTAYLTGICMATPVPEHCEFAIGNPTNCPFGCSVLTGLCNPDPCAGVVCDQAPGDCFQDAGVCDGGHCTYLPKESGVACDDGNACTGNDVCDSEGACAGTDVTCTTPPNDQCYEAAGTCVAGECQYVPKAEATACDDTNLCTESDACGADHVCKGVERVCEAVAPTCEPDNVSRTYVDGQCIPIDGHCTYTTVDASCQYGCDAGSGLCVGDACATVVCDQPPSTCHLPVGTCSAGECSYALRSAGATCDDGNACTTVDKCQADGTCTGTELSCTTPPNAQCYAAEGTCVSGECTYLPKDAGAACDDGDACTDGDTCKADQACAGTPKTCDTPPNAQCYGATGSCTAGECAYEAKEAGTTCDDGSLCTEDDACSADHACAGTIRTCPAPAPTCVDGMAHLQQAACDPADGLCKDSPLADVVCDLGCATDGLCKRGVLISEFRTRGPAGGNDEFIELFNAGDDEVDVSGWKFEASSSGGSISSRATIAAGVRMPPKSFLLLVNFQTTAGYSGSVPGDATYTTGIGDTGGLGLTDAAGVVVDQVGLSPTSGFKEGTTLAAMTTTQNTMSYRRNTATCGPDQDTGDNARDFTLVADPAPENSMTCRPACAGAPCLDRVACLDAGTSTAMTGGTCTASVCTWTSTPTACPDGCSATTGRCIDLCDGVTCSTPPNAQCFEPAGTCRGGTCEYVALGQGTACDDGARCTTGDSCNATSACVGTVVTCTTPVPACQPDGSSRTFGTGTCQPDDGTCEFPSTDTPCPAGCDEATGLCRIDTCGDVTCDQPPDACHETYGICSGGACQYAFRTVGAACDDDDHCTENDSCGPDHLCKGSTILCLPPAAECQVDGSSRTFSAGTCKALDGTCEFQVTDTPCDQGCNASSGLCNGDPCTDVTCDQPPSGCHLPVGTCSAGECAYDFKPAGAGCDDSEACTVRDECTGDGHCEGTAQACDTPPAPACVDGDTSRTFEALGTCESVGGTCQYDSTDETCDQGCDAATGFCKDGCEGVTCATPPGACHAAAGTCNHGTCTYAPLESTASCDDLDACTIGDHCDGHGACVAGAPNPACGDLGPDVDGDTSTPDVPTTDVMFPDVPTTDVPALDAVATDVTTTDLTTTDAPTTDAPADLSGDATLPEAVEDVPTADSSDESVPDNGSDVPGTDVEGTDLATDNAGPDSGRDVLISLDIVTTDAAPVSTGSGGGCSTGTDASPYGVFAPLALFLAMMVLRRRRTGLHR